VADKRSTIACRGSSYGPFESGAYAHLASLGIRHVEIMVPPVEAIAATAAELGKHGLSASSLHGECDLARADIAELIAEQMPAFKALNCELMFASVRREYVAEDIAYSRLREAGEVAGRHGVTIVVETHPDLATNADVAMRTMRGVDHPRVRLNFDTANIYFYNRDADCVEQLRRVAPYVAAVHLKDTDGGYRHWHFPALGKGIVNFPGIFAALDEAGFDGPCTLEIEGIEGEEKTEESVQNRIAASVDYLRRLGRL
jgi:sugar phosphate isomerase/epimerase